MLKIIRTLLVLVIVAGIISLLPLFFPRRSSPVVTSSPTLPSGWNIVVDQESQVKIQKHNTDQKIHPSVVLISHPISSVTTPDKHVADLKSGAVLAIPSLKYLTDDVIDNVNYDYGHRLTGYYTNSGLKVHLVQLLIIKSKTIYTLTASHLGDPTTQAEIEQVLDYLSQTRLAP